MENKIVVITGGTGNVGKVAAMRYASLGARVYIMVRNKFSEAQDFIKTLPNQELKHEAFFSSITNTESIKKTVQEITTKAGKCDLLINAAGITKGISSKEIEKYTDEVIDEILINNVRGTFSTIREFLPLLKLSSSPLIINITSASALRASGSNIIYGASKSAIELMTKSLSKSLAPNIRVVSICPGMLDSPTSGAFKPSGWNEKVSQEIPLRRVGSAEDVVDAIEAVDSKLKYMTGSSILLDGGRLA